VIDEGKGGLLEAAGTSGALHSATDVSHRNTAILVSGPGAAQAINAGCPLDLSLAAFPVGACSRTLFGKVEVVLLRTANDAFRMEVWRSFSGYAFGLLGEGAIDAAL
jgi:sarcosine oxidase subunit gamma